MKQLLAALLYVLCSAPAFAQNEQKIYQLDSLFNALHRQGRFSGNVLIAEQGKPLYKGSFGLANEETGEKLNENSVFDLASVSKPFTAMAIALLKERGKLSYDDKLASRIPELAFYDKVTIRHLLTHSSGLIDFRALMSRDSLWDKSKAATNSDVIRAFDRSRPELLFEPGSREEYSNTGYVFMASIIERVSGMSYADFLSKNIFVPLGMHNTLVYTRRSKPQPIPNYAYGYIYSDNLKRNILPDSLEDYRRVIIYDPVVGQAGISSTAGDLLKWDRALYTDKLVSKESLQEIFRPALLSNGKYAGHSLGWMVARHHDYGTMTAHTGGWPGYVTLIERHPDNDKTIIMLQNNYTNASMPLDAVRAILYGRPVPAEPESAVRREISVPAEILSGYVGEYEVQPGYTILVSLEGTELRARFPEQETYPIYAESPSKFFYKVVDARIEFFRDAGNKVNRLVLYQGGAEIGAKKIK